jgi:hypothetical protein
MSFPIFHGQREIEEPAGLALQSAPTLPAAKVAEARAWWNQQEYPVASNVGFLLPAEVPRAKSTRTSATGAANV